MGKDDPDKELRKTLLTCFQPTDPPMSQEWNEATNTAPAEILVEALLDVVRWARAELQESEAGSTRQQLRAEQRELHDALRAARDALGNLSPDLDRLIGATANPVSCADALDTLLPAVAAAADRIAALPKSERAVEREGAIATELARRVADVLLAHGQKASASGDAYFGYTSPAIEILSAIGAAVGLVRVATSWRNILAKAKAEVRSDHPVPQPKDGEAANVSRATGLAHDYGLVINAVRLGLAGPPSLKPGKRLLTNAVRVTNPPDPRAAEEDPPEREG